MKSFGEGRAAFCIQLLSCSVALRMSIERRGEVLPRPRDWKKGIKIKAITPRTERLVRGVSCCA